MENFQAALEAGLVCLKYFCFKNKKKERKETEGEGYVFFFLLFFQMWCDEAQRAPESAVLCVRGERCTYESHIIKETDVYL